MAITGQITDKKTGLEVNGAYVRIDSVLIVNNKIEKIARVRIHTYASELAYKEGFEPINKEEELFSIDLFLNSIKNGYDSISVLKKFEKLKNHLDD